MYCNQAKNTHGKTKEAWYGAEAYLKGTISYVPQPYSFKPYQVSELTLQDFRNVDRAFNWLVMDLSTVSCISVDVLPLTFPKIWIIMQYF